MSGLEQTGNGRAVPLIAHVVPQFSVGGMENGVVNLLNRIPSSRYRHAVIAIQDTPDFQKRLRNPDVEVVSMHKRLGKDFPAYWRLTKVLRRMRPDVVYTHSMATLDVVFYAAAAGVRLLVHGEHGQASAGMGGAPKRSVLRALTDRLINHYTTVSKDLADFLVNSLKIAPTRVTHIYNGVDLERFRPRAAGEPALVPEGYLDEDSLVVGTVGRMEPIKDQITLVRAFLRLQELRPDLRPRLRLTLVGEGRLRNECLRLLREGGVEDRRVWSTGERSDIPDLMRGMDVFVLPSTSEGTSNTILEAMASGLPVVATDVGGNPELVEAEKTGCLVPSKDPEAMAAAIVAYIDDAAMRYRHGAAARCRAERNFGMNVMVDKYLEVCEKVLRRRPGR